MKKRISIENVFFLLENYIFYRMFYLYTKPMRWGMRSAQARGIQNNKNKNKNKKNK